MKWQKHNFGNKGMKDKKKIEWSKHTNKDRDVRKGKVQTLFSLPFDLFSVFTNIDMDIHSFHWLVMQW